MADEKIDYGKLVTLKIFCKQHELEYRQARKMAKAGEFPHAVEVLGRWGIPVGAPVPEMPEKGTRRVAREDGRQRLIVWATAEERATIEGMGCEVLDPRVRAKERREARKAAQLQADVEAAKEIEAALTE